MVKYDLVTTDLGVMYDPSCRAPETKTLIKAKLSMVIIESISYLSVS